jgi:hypothetical protein
VTPCGAGGMPGGDDLPGRGAASSVGGVVVPLHLQRLWWYFAVPFRHARQPAVWFCKPLPGVLQLQPSPSYAQETQLLTSSLLGLRCEVASLVVVCPLWWDTKPSFGYFRDIQGKAHVRLFQRYPTSLPRHNSRHVENRPEISCCF